jgi:hypothetical protein
VQQSLDANGQCLAHVGNVVQPKCAPMSDETRTHILSPDTGLTDVSQPLGEVGPHL